MYRNGRPYDSLQMNWSTCCLCRSGGRRSRRSRSRSVSRGRRRATYSQRDRWKREPSHSPVLILRKNRTPTRKNCSSGKSPQRISELGQLICNRSFERYTPTVVLFVLFLSFAFWHHCLYREFRCHESQSHISYYISMSTNDWRCDVKSDFFQILVCFALDITALPIHSIWYFLATLAWWGGWYLVIIHTLCVHFQIFVKNLK